MKNKLYGVGLVAGLVLALAVAPTAGAQTNAERLSRGEATTVTSVVVPFEHPVRLSDAIETTSVAGNRVLAYRFENDAVVGEYAVDSSISADEFVTSFVDSFATEPLIVGAVVEEPVATAKATTSSRALAQISTSAPAYEAPPVDDTKSESLREFRSRVGSPTSRLAAAAASPSTWKPTQADIKIFRVDTKSVYFEQFYYWDGVKAKTTVMNADDGFEAEVNVYTSRPDAETCGSGKPQDYPFAKNYGWTWYAFVNTGAGMKKASSAIGAYADYNDNSDPCNRNSIAIGIRTPQSIPASSAGTQELMVTVLAPRGKDNTGKIGGVVQAVNETGCNLQPWLASTDCMGITSSSAGSRATLGTSRNWTAPPKCWLSKEYGSVAPVSYTC